MRHASYLAAAAAFHEAAARGQKTIFASALDALHESRRFQAQRILRQYRHLIAESGGGRPHHSIPNIGGSKDASVQTANSSEGLFVLNCDLVSVQTVLPRKEAAEASNDPGPQGRPRWGGDRLRPTASRAARWRSLDRDQRAVFNVWAKSFAAFYSLIIVSLLAAAVLLDLHQPAGPNAVTASATLERSLADSSAPGSGRIDK